MNQLNLLVKDWLTKADSDFRYAKASFESFDDFYSQICILCHDAVEKYLKAFLIFNKIKPEKIHDLVTIYRQCVEVSKEDPELENVEDECKRLNLYYVPLKYPSHYPVVDRTKAKEAIEATEKIAKVIKDRLKV